MSVLVVLIPQCGHRPRGLEWDTHQEEAREIFRTWRKTDNEKCSTAEGTVRTEVSTSLRLLWSEAKQTFLCLGKHPCASGAYLEFEGKKQKQGQRRQELQGCIFIHWCHNHQRITNTVRTTTAGFDWKHQWGLWRGVRRGQSRVQQQSATEWN